MITAAQRTKVIKISSPWGRLGGLWGHIPSDIGRV